MLYLSRLGYNRLDIFLMLTIVNYNKRYVYFLIRVPIYTDDNYWFFAINVHAVYTDVLWIKFTFSRSKYVQGTSRMFSSKKTHDKLFKNVCHGTKSIKSCRRYSYLTIVILSNPEQHTYNNVSHVYIDSIIIYTDIKSNEVWVRVKSRPLKNHNVFEINAVRTNVIMAWYHIDTPAARASVFDTDVM